MKRTRDFPAKTLIPADIVRLVGTSTKMVVERLDEAGIYADCIWDDKDDNLNCYLRRMPWDRRHGIFTVARLEPGVSPAP